MKIGYFLSCEEYTPAELVEQERWAAEATVAGSKCAPTLAAGDFGYVLPTARSQGLAPQQGWTRVSLCWEAKTARFVPPIRPHPLSEHR